MSAPRLSRIRAEAFISGVSLALEMRGMNVGGLAVLLEVVGCDVTSLSEKPQKDGAPYATKAKCTDPVLQQSDSRDLYRLLLPAKCLAHVYAWGRSDA